MNCCFTFLLKAHCRIGNIGTNCMENHVIQNIKLICKRNEKLSKKKTWKIEFWPFIPYVFLKCFPWANAYFIITINITSRFVIFFFNQEPNVTELQSSILLNCEQQKYIKHVNDSGWSLSGWKRWRWFPLHDLCITRNVWRMLMITHASCVVIGQCSSGHMTRFRKLPWRLP